ncbi:carboxypeptidase-like regulatory domain-containing protein [Mucilaginibacter sp. CSA2-8R]|uniref:carboxypeptidase-like regulatory domain-containing protein n=1 Tax=Mucilaginibacter sp. CSA2-8R TaxID=3141542 RepID=UPI00315DEA00
MLQTYCRIFVSLACLWLYCRSSFAQRADYAAGYRELHYTDSARRYQASATASSMLYYRPVQVDVWYPAIGPDHARLDYRHFLSLFERRANEYQTETRYDSIATEMLGQFTMTTGATPGALPTQSLLNAQPAAGKFPVIVYLCAYNGMSYENVALFEQLARAGYYVLSISSVGRYPGNMSTRYEDALEQARDAAFAVRHINTALADTSRIGIIGYSYGSLAAVLLTHQLQSVRCFLSLDGSEKHYYGRDRQEDLDFNDCRTKGNLTFRPGCTYAYLESDHKARDGKTDSVYTPMVTSRQYYSRLANAAHEDFSHISVLSIASSKMYPQVIKLAQNYADQLLKDKPQQFEQQLQRLTISKVALAQPENTVGAAVTLQLAGKITDQNHQPIAYASVGMLDADAGTISNADGGFLFILPDSLKHKTLRVSAIGYQSVLLPVSKLQTINTQKGSIVLLKDVQELPAVTVSASQPQYKTVGNTSRSKFFSVGFPFTDLGSEVGVILSLGKQKVLLQSFNCHISYNRMDSCTFRLNIYSVKNGLPDANLLTQNIIARIGSKPGSYTINLQPYHLLLNGDVCVALEWIDGMATAKNSALFFSGALLSSSYHRKTAQGRWTKLKGVGAAFHLKVQKL